MANMELLSFKCTPAGSLLTASPEERELLLEQLGRLPEAIRIMLTSLGTGSYLRGLVKSVGLSVEQTPLVAFIVLQVATGEIPLAQLGSFFSSKLQVAIDIAQAMAKDIEKELFGPVMMELNQYLQAKQVPGQGSSTAMPNLLDLRKQGPVTGNQ